jgi:hypothetical protein
MNLISGDPAPTGAMFAVTLHLFLSSVNCWALTSEATCRQGLDMDQANEPTAGVGSDEA